MKVLVTGSDGYCGWPIVLKLMSEGHIVFGVDNGGRRSWVDEVRANSILPIKCHRERADTANEAFIGEYNYKNFDLTNYNEVVSIIRTITPDVILHVASQPSAPYAGIDIHHCNFTQTNNTQMLRNIMWALNSLGLNNTHLVVTTTTGIYGAPDFDIPEGNIIVNKEELPFPSMGGSWYHMSRAFDASNMWLANRFFKFPITELRTSIVCGTSTIETNFHSYLENRFDADFYFGVVVNRFVSQALVGKDLTIYGKGLQKKPMISLTDMVRSTVECINIDTNNRENNYVIYNQLEKEIAIVDIANTIQEYCSNELHIPISVSHIKNPRTEDEEHQMVMKNEKFVSDLCGGDFEEPLVSSIETMCEELYPHRERILRYVRE